MSLAIAPIPQTAVALRNILIATDFSECSERALRHGVAIASHYGSTLHLLHVVSPVSFFLGAPEAYVGGADALAQAVGFAHHDTETLLRRIAGPIRLKALKHRNWVIPGGVWETMCTIVRSENIDLAIVGTHGRTGLRKVFLGSVAEDVFRRCSCPVLTIGPHAPGAEPETLRLQHILFPTDLSEDSARAVPWVLSAAREWGSRITVLHIIERLEGEAARDSARVQRVLEARMRDLVGSAGAIPPNTDFEFAVGSIEEDIVQAAERHHSDLIVLGLKAPDSYVDRLPWMHAYKVVCEVGCPVLTVRGTSGREHR
jgi:nucleotide-binding universal stress UspA family protein